MGMETRIECQFVVGRTGRNRAFIKTLRDIIAWERDPENYNNFFSEVSIQPTPEHEFFHGQRAGFITNRLREERPFHYCVEEAEFKNYDHDIQKFLDWISPHIESITGTYQYEEEWTESTLSLQDGKVVIVKPANEDDWGNAWR